MIKQNKENLKAIGSITNVFDPVQAFQREDGTFVVPLRIEGKQPCISGKPILCYTQYENHALYLEQGGTNTFDLVEGKDVILANRRTKRVDVELDSE